MEERVRGSACVHVYVRVNVHSTCGCVRVMRSERVVGSDDVHNEPFLMQKVTFVHFGLVNIDVSIL